MTWPYIDKQIINAGSAEEPDFKEMPKLVWIPSTNKGPYQECRTCRANKAEKRKEFLLKNPEEVDVYESPKGQPLQRREPKYPPFKVEYSLPGSANCLKHTSRYYRGLRDAKTITQDQYESKLEYLESQELIHTKQRMGAYYIDEQDVADTTK